MKVKDQNWVCAIEVAVGFSTLIGFAVDNQSDGDVLRGIISQVLSQHRGKPHPPVFTGSFDGRVYDVQRNVSNYTTPCFDVIISLMYSLYTTLYCIESDGLEE